jgi:hypothetical protein
MSVWGPGPFENDDAVDWLADLKEEPGLDLLVDALSEIADYTHVGYIEVPQACEAIAAAEILVQLLDKSRRTNAIDAPAWSNLEIELSGKSQTEIRRFVGHATAALDRIFHDPDDSELLQVWQEGRVESASWTVAMQDLLGHLKTLAGAIDP